MRKLIFLGLYILLSIQVSQAKSLDEIKNSKTIRIGVWTNQPPYSNFVDGRFEGFEVDMAKTIGKNITGNGDVELVGITNGSQRIEFLEQDKVDLVIASFTDTKERRERVNFSLPYFSVAMGAIVNKNRGITKESDLIGKRIVIQKGTTMEQYVPSLRSSELIKTDGSIDAFAILREDKADAYIDDNLVVMAYAIIDREYITPSGLRNLGFSSYLGVGIAKDNSELLKAVNQEMIKLSKEGFFRKVFNETFVPFYKNEVEAKYFLLEDLYSIYG